VLLGLVERSAVVLSQQRPLRKNAGAPFVIPSVPGFPATQPWETPACAAFCKESRINMVNASDLDRKSGVAEGSAVARPSTVFQKISQMMMGTIVAAPAAAPFAAHAAPAPPFLVRLRYADSAFQDRRGSNGVRSFES
jgi:hypothetical protein